MGQLLSFSLCSSILLAIMYLAYKWALASENYHRLNRAILWSIYLISLGIVPLYDYVSRSLVATHSATTHIDMELYQLVPIVTDAVPAHAQFPWLEALIWIYVAGMATVFCLTMVNFWKLATIIKRGEHIVAGGKNVILTDDASLAPFSFCQVIVIPRKDFISNGEVILLHEKSHVELKHWIDLLFAQIVCVLQWFNPAAWLMREEMKTVHEYQADARVISSGTNPKEYQMLLIKKAVGARFPSLANSLNHSKLKKRITMMYNSDSASRRRLRPLLLLPALGAALWISQLPAVASALSSVSSTELTKRESADKVSDISADAQPNEATLASTKGKISKITLTTPASSASTTKTSAPATSENDAADDDSAPRQMVEKLAEFPGGMKALMEYVVANTRIPDGYKGDGGRVIVSFVIEKDGSVGEAKIIRGKDPLLDTEAIRVVKSLPKWIPGKMNGKPVATWYTMPISFKLVDDAKTSTDKPENTTTSMSTSVSTSTDASGKTTTSVVGYTMDGDKKINIIASGNGQLPENMVIYLNGELFYGNINDIQPSDIESITVNKTDDKAPEMLITTKKK